MKHLFTLLLVVCCILSGYFFFKMNQGDTFNAIFFAIGLTGIVLSLLRNQKKDTEKQDQNQ